MKETEKIIGKIMQAWNDKIAPEGRKLDTMSPYQKTKWFKSVEIDFEETKNKNSDGKRKK